MRRAVGCAVGLGISGLIVFAVWSLFRSLQAETTLHATKMVIDAFISFHKREGRLARSWEELATVEVSPRAGFDWPSDVVRIQEYVRVNFRVANDKVGHEPGWSRELVIPRKPTYGDALTADLDKLEDVVGR